MPNMKVILLLCLFTVVFGYNDISEAIDIEAIYSNPETEKAYIDCFLGRAICTKAMLVQKNHIQEIVKDACHECTPIQKSSGMKALKIVLNKYPAHALEMRAKFDPDGKYFGNFLKFMAENQ